MFVSYRTWTHAGLWPGIKERQAGYVYSPNVFAQAFWDNRWAPGAQMDALAALGHGVGASDPDKEDDFILVSDVGGEIRGLNRAWAVESVDNAEKFASYYCQLKQETYEAFGGPTPSSTCADMFLPLDDASFAPCDCSTYWPFPVGAGHRYRLLIAGDMFSRWHNGDRELYQLPYGGVPGASTDARDKMPGGAVFLAWWHLDAQKDGRDIVGHEMAAALVEDFLGAAKSVVGATGWDPENIRTWSALAAAWDPTESQGVLGLAHYGWGSEAEGPRYMSQAGQYAWQPEWKALDTWFISDDADAPGGDEQALPPSERWTRMGFAGPLEDDAAGQRPFVNQWLETWSGGTWTSPWVQLDAAYVPTLDQLSPYGFEADEDWSQVLIRFYGRLPNPDCQLSVQAEFRDGPNTVVVPMTVLQGDVGSADGDVLWAWSARAPVTALTSGLPGSTEVQVTVDYIDCGTQQAAAVFDNPTLYQGLPWVDFPYEYTENTLDAGLDPWASDEPGDVWDKVCGVLPTDPLCIHTNTMNAR